MAPADFNALCEGYENKKHAEQELMRQQTFMIVSPYITKGTGYSSFKNQWQFSWEKSDAPEPVRLTAEQMEEIKNNHQRVLAKAKENGNSSRT